MGLEQGLSIRAIARILKRAPSTISRETERHLGGASYRCRFAHPATAAHVLQAFTDKLNGKAQPMRKTLTCDRRKDMDTTSRRVPAVC